MCSAPGGGCACSLRSSLSCWLVPCIWPQADVELFHGSKLLLSSSCHTLPLTASSSLLSLSPGLACSAVFPHAPHLTPARSWCPGMSGAQAAAPLLAARLAHRDKKASTKPCFCSLGQTHLRQLWGGGGGRCVEGTPSAPWWFSSSCFALLVWLGGSAAKVMGGM